METPVWLPRKIPLSIKFRLWVSLVIAILYAGGATRAGHWQAGLIGAGLIGGLNALSWLLGRGYGIGTDSGHVYLRNAGPFGGPVRRVRFDELAALDVPGDGDAFRLTPYAEDAPDIVVVGDAFQRGALAAFLDDLRGRRPDLFNAELESELAPFQRL